MKTIKEQMNDEIKKMKAIQKRICNAERVTYTDCRSCSVQISYETAMGYIENAIDNIREARKYITQAERKK